jgi:4'-phosphopantetheinyl transferase
MAEWSNPVAVPELSHDTIDVWRTNTDQPAEYVASLYDILGADERERADRFYFEKHRRRFIVARGVLRQILAQYLCVPARAVAFEYSEHGKPSIINSANPRNIRFNVSHSNECALFAFTLRREVGVDVEYIRADLDVESLARHSFSAGEVHVLCGLPPAERREAFFNCWTRKEAFIKAHGEGLSLGLDRFDVTLVPGEAAALRRFEVNPAELSLWTMCSLGVSAGYKAALAVEGHGWDLRCWEYPCGVLLHR